MHWSSVVGIGLAPIVGMALPHVTAWIRRHDSNLLERYPWLLLRKRRLPYVDADFRVVETQEGQPSPQIEQSSALRPDVLEHQGEP